MPHFLMCPPGFYAISYEINPWMDINNPADLVRAHNQWEMLYETICRSGADVSLIEPVEEMPDMVFTANAGLVHGDTVILSSFKYKERQGEEVHYRKWFSEQGYHCHTLPHGISFEGEGDAVYYKDIILLGYGFRTDILSHPPAGKILDRGYISLELINPHFYHLDTCLQYIEELNLIIYYPEAFHPKGVEHIERLPSDILRISTEDAFYFVCNSICIDKNLLLYKCTGTLTNKFKEYGLNIITLDTSEFMKSGGGVRCMVLRLTTS